MRTVVQLDAEEWPTIGALDKKKVHMLRADAIQCTLPITTLKALFDSKDVREPDLPASVTPS